MLRFCTRNRSEPTVHDGSLPTPEGPRACYPLSWRQIVPVLAIFCLLLGVGCQATEQIRGVGSNPEAIAEIEEQSTDQEAILTLVTGDERPVKAIRVGADSVRWTHAHTAEQHVAPRTCVERVRFERHDKGFLQGLGIGTGVGLVAGGTAIAGLSAGGRCEGLAALACGLLGIATLTVATVSGSIFGAVRGHEDNFVIQPTSRDACPRAGSPPGNRKKETRTDPSYR